MSINSIRNRKIPRLIILILILILFSCSKHLDENEQTKLATSTITLHNTEIPPTSSSPSPTQTTGPTKTPQYRVNWRFRGSSAGVPSWDLTDTNPSNDDLLNSIKRMKLNGVNWYLISTTWFMPNAWSTETEPLNDKSDLHPDLGNHIVPTISDERLIEMINLFQDEGIQVFLRPNLEVNDGKTWRGQINPTNWEDWFASYSEFIIHYAKIAHENDVNLFSIGFELNSTVTRTDDWNNLIESIRNEYSGDISYDCGGLLYHGSESSFETDQFGSSWEEVSTGDFLYNVDYIGIDWYPQVAKDPNTSIEEIQENIENISNRFMVPVWEKYEKPIFFAEIDYSSMEKTTVNPLHYRWGGPVDEAEQAKAYEAVFRIFSDKLWFEGMFPAGFYLKVFEDTAGTTNSLWFKEAEETFQFWYGEE